MRDKIFKNIVYLFTIFSLMMVFLLIIFLVSQSKLFFSKHTISSFIFGERWSVLDGFRSFGIFNILMSSLSVASLACIISFPIAFGTSLFITVYAGRTKNIIKSLVSILAGIPSIVYGFFGLFCIVRLLESGLKLSSGESLLAGSLLLAIMIFPYFVSSVVDTMESLIENHKQDSDSLGISKEFFIRKILLKGTLLAVFSSFIFAFSRAIGETMAVMMVIGNTPLFPKLLSKIQTIPSLIALEVGMSEVGSEHYSGLFASGLILLIIVFIINIILFFVDEKRRRDDKI